jgi:uncharacterized membrane protein YtjA (UPF0391 family)
LAADFTGVIPSGADGRFRRLGSVLFPGKPVLRHFRAAAAPELLFRSRLGSAIGAASAGVETEFEKRGRVMLSWVVTFLVIALIAGVLGFGGIAGVSIEIAKTIFFIAVVLFLISAVVGLVRGRTNV